MKNDKAVQKIPEYSVDKIITRSDLATRGMKELGLLKDKKHYTIIYVCQYCGRLINYSSTPCIYCGKFPQEKREIVIAQALSSESMSVFDQLSVCNMVKRGKDLEIEIDSLRELIDRVVSGDKQTDKKYQMLFTLAKNMAENRSATDEKTERACAMTKAQCLECGEKIGFVMDKCQKCGTKFSGVQKMALAIKQILEFVEIFLDEEGEDEESLEELIFVLVYTLTRAVEKDEYPDQELLKYISELLHKIHYIISRSQGVGVAIKDGEASRIGGSDGDAKTKEDWLSVMLAYNVDHLLQEYKKNTEILKNVVKLTGDEYLQIGSLVEHMWKDAHEENPPQFVIFMGGVGSGKTTIRREKFSEGYVHFDAGEIYAIFKKGLGEEHPRLSTFANFGTDLILREAIQGKKNIVIEIIGETAEPIMGVIDAMKGIGYDVSLNTITCDIAEARKRHLQAVKEDPDYLSAYYTQESTLLYFYHYFNLGEVPIKHE